MFEDLTFLFMSISFLLQLSTDEVREQNLRKKGLGKTNFVEVRSFLQIFRSFKRMWSFYILSLQVGRKHCTSNWLTFYILLWFFYVYVYLFCIAGDDNYGI